MTHEIEGRAPEKGENFTKKLLQVDLDTGKTLILYSNQKIYKDFKLFTREDIQKLKEDLEQWIDEGKE